jgi:hypothetical protein
VRPQIPNKMPMTFTAWTSISVAVCRFGPEEVEESSYGLGSHRRPPFWVSGFKGFAGKLLMSEGVLNPGINVDPRSDESVTNSSRGAAGAY